MSSAKKIILKPIQKKIADEVVKKYHYSGKVVQNSQLNFGVFYKGLLLGALQFGPPTDKRKMITTVKNAGWNDFLELNRMAFSDVLPKFSESRAISLSLKWIKKNAPQIKWIVSFADGTQCGHGTIYQASNFKLVQIKKNTSIIKLPNGKVTHELSFRINISSEFSKDMKAKNITNMNEYLNTYYKGWERINGYMFKYIYFLDKEAEQNFTGEFIPFSRIKDLGIGMYKGKKIK